MQIVSCGVQEIIKLMTFFKKLLDEVNYRWSKLCFKTTKNFGNLSILPIQLMKMVISVEFEGPLQISLMYVQTACTNFCLTMDNILFNVN